MIGSEKVLSELNITQMRSIKEYQRQESEYKKRIAELEDVIEEIQAAKDTAFEEAHAFRVANLGDTADKYEDLGRTVERLARENAEYESANEEDAEVIHLLQKRIAELEKKHKLLLSHTIPRQLSDSLRLEWVNIPYGVEIDDYIDGLLSAKLE